MKIKSWITAFALFFSVLSVGYVGGGPAKAVAEGRTTLTSEVSQTVTVGQMADFLQTKKEHYPLSDQFMERYQQTSGGYLDNAKKAGILIDRQQHSPNQKWHFFESWYYASLEEGTFTREDDAKSKIYSRLLCPELLLWIYEASGVAPAKVKKAMDAAVAGKIEGAAVSTIAKNMRACVAWEDIAAAFAVKVPAESVSLDKTELSLLVGESATVRATVSPVGATDYAAWSVVEGEDIISITQKSNQVTVKGLKEGSAKIKVSYNEEVFAECTVTVEANDELPPPPVAAEGVYAYTISYDLGTRVTAKQIESADEVFNTFVLSGDGEGIITSVSDIVYIYGGGNGGKNETKWYAGNLLKFGTTSNNGSLTLHLSGAVNYVKITGYAYDNAAKLQVGDTQFLCTDINEVSKEIVEGGQTSTALITFTATDTLTIATLNKKPLFIAAIEFGYEE